MVGKTRQRPMLGIAVCPRSGAVRRVGSLAKRAPETFSFPLPILLYARGNVIVTIVGHARSAADFDNRLARPHGEAPDPLDIVEVGSALSHFEADGLDPGR
jgi:hypothetical protein